MFGMFREAKIKALCLGDTLAPMQAYAGINLHDLANKENFDLREAALGLLTQTVGEQKSYHSFEMVCATWVSLINLLMNDPSHSFAGNSAQLERGFQAYLAEQVDIATKNGMPRGLFAAIERYL